MDFLFQLNLGHPVDSKSGLIHFWASNLLDALFILYGKKGEKKMKKGKERDWQKDAGNLKTDKIQLWSASGTMIGLRPRIDAEVMVKEERAFVMCDQAIGLFDRE